MTEPKSDTYRGWLFKWTNYIKGIWFDCQSQPMPKDCFQS